MHRASFAATAVALTVGVTSVYAWKAEPLPPRASVKALEPPIGSGSDLLQPRVPVGDTLYREKPAPLPALSPAAKIRMAASARAQYADECGVHLSRIVRGDHDKKLVALTFDDGPHAGYTIKLLQVLKALRVKATFFLVGKQVDKFPQLVQREALEGHELGNHTYDHVDLTQIPPELIGFELDACDRSIRQATGSSARFFRPPGGQFATDVMREAEKRHFITALWSDDPGDYAKPGADVVLQRTMDHLENGSIILLHDGIPDTMSVLPILVSQARKRGFEFVTMSELAKAKQGDHAEQLARAIPAR